MSQPNTPDVSVSDQVSSSISAAAHAYQTAMQQQSTTPTSAASPAAQAAEISKDVVMNDNTPDIPAVSKFLT